MTPEQRLGLVQAMTGLSADEIEEVGGMDIEERVARNRAFDINRKRNVCAGCSARIVLDYDASAWLRRDVWIDPQTVDVGNTGTCCSNGEDHRPVTS